MKKDIFERNGKFLGNNSKWDKNRIYIEYK